MFSSQRYEVLRNALNEVPRMRVAEPYGIRSCGSWKTSKIFGFGLDCKFTKATSFPISQRLKELAYIQSVLKYRLKFFKHPFGTSWLETLSAKAELTIVLTYD